MHIFESYSISKYTKIVIVKLVKLKGEVEAFMISLIEGESGERCKRLAGNKFNLLIKDNIQINKCKKKIFFNLLVLPQHHLKARSWILNSDV